MRDLIWALTSPSMFDHPAAVQADWGLAEIARNRGLLSRLDRPGSVLQRAVENRATDRLGEYFEILLSTWLDEIPPARLLAKNLQIHGREGTIGEFDLLFDRDGFTHHWELAVKYYLGYPDRGGWIGPNPADDLQAKWQKMLHKQLTLAEHPLGRQAVVDFGGHDVRAEAYVKGYLFESLNPRYRADDHADVNPECPRGFWVHRGELDEYPPDVPPETRWLKLGKLRWMSDPVVGPDDQLSSLSDLLVRHPEGSLFVAGFCRKRDGWQPVGRGFVVDDHWPQAD